MCSRESRTIGMYIDNTRVIDLITSTRKKIEKCASDLCLSDLVNKFLDQYDQAVQEYILKSVLVHESADSGEWSASDWSKVEMLNKDIFNAVKHVVVLKYGNYKRTGTTY